MKRPRKLSQEFPLIGMTIRAILVELRNLGTPMEWLKAFLGALAFWLVISVVWILACA